MTANYEAASSVSAVEQLQAIVASIDPDECASGIGWWETSACGEFGARKLVELETVVTTLID